MLRLLIGVLALRSKWNSLVACPLNTFTGTLDGQLTLDLNRSGKDPNLA